MPHHAAASAVVVASLAGTTLSPEELEFFGTYRPAGVTLFRRNIPDPYADLSKLTKTIQSFCTTNEPPLMIAIDQEGGRVSRIGAPFPNRGPAQGLAGGQTSAVARDEIRAYASEVGRALLALGINVNFAPVVDILTEPSNTAIGDRVFGTTVETVIPRATAYLEGLQSTGVLGCLKHFPGQGDAKHDTHKHSTSISLSEHTLRTREFLPFQALVPKAPMVMISHCIYPAFDQQPAGLSRTIIETVLRREMGFQGVVVSDDMIMEAIPQDEQTWVEQIVAAVAAGIDCVLVCKHIERARLAIDGLSAEAARSPIFATCLQEAATRVTKLRHKLSGV